MGTDRPVHTLVLCFIFCAVFLSVSSTFCLRYLEIKKAEDADYTNVPLEELGVVPSDSAKEGATIKKYGASRRGHISLLAAGIVCLTLRVFLFERILNVSQCTSRSYEVFLAFLLGLYDWNYQKNVQIEVDDRPDMSVYEALQASIKVWWIGPKWRYTPSALLLGVGCYMTTALWTSQTSTYICPTASGHVFSIPRLQQFSLLLDCLLAIIVCQFSSHDDASQHRRSSLPTSCSVVLIGSASCWVGYAIVLFILRPENGRWLFLLDTPSTISTIFSILWQITLFCIFFTATVYSVSLLRSEALIF